MAQMHEDKGNLIERLWMVVRQRPAYAAAAALVAVAVAGAAALGAVQAQAGGSVEIERASDADAGDDDADAAVEQADAEDGDASEDESDTVVVDVDGAVAEPQVVELPAGSRVADAIEAAGGLTDDADVSSINRAAVLTDGEKIYIPAEGEEVSSSTVSSASTSSSSSSASELVNINTADADELDTLPGIGPALAQAIIDDREANGAFTSVEDIMRVSGIGEAKYANLKDLICV